MPLLDDIRSARDTATEEAEKFAASSFWRTPVGPPPELPQPKVDEPSTVPAVAAEQPRPASEAHATGSERPRTISQLRVSELTTDELKRRISEFEADFMSQNGRRVALTDAPRLPKEMLALYDQLGRRLNPEEVAKAQALWRSKEAAAKEAEAAAAREAARRASADEARAREWAEFEANQADMWKSAVSSARDQRSEVAEFAGIAAHELSGAASMVRPPDVQKPSAPTRAEYIQQVLDSRGLIVQEGPTQEEQEEEEARWAKDGADADAVARAEAWEKAEAERLQCKSAGLSEVDGELGALSVA